jgi:anti-anti-sigma factor
MSERQWRHVVCSVVVIQLTETDIRGDAQADDLRDELLALYQSSGATHAVIDFRDVTYLSSAGFRPLLRFNRQVRENGGRLVLCNLQPDVQEVFTVTRLISDTREVPAAFEAQPDLTAAVASLA